MRHGDSSLDGRLPDAHPRVEDVVGVLRAALPAPVGSGYRAGGAEAVVAHPEEEAQLGPRAVPRRHAEYQLGRAAARRALFDLGGGAVLAWVRLPPAD